MTQRSQSRDETGHAQGCRAEGRRAEDGLGADRKADVTALLRRALAGESLTLDRNDYSLHDLTQIALALRSDAGLAIRHAAAMSPIERASVATVGGGRVVFL